MKTALIIHGAYGNPNENWIPWLKSKLEKLGYLVLVPSFPTPQMQNLENWMSIIEKDLSKLDARSVMVGHSTGATFMLSILEKLNNGINTSVFVSGFMYGHSLEYPSVDIINKSFYDKNFDWSKIKGNAGNVAVFHGDNDPYVPLEESKDFAGKLGVKTTVIQDGGHLNESAGYVEFPKLLEYIVAHNNTITT